MANHRSSNQLEAADTFRYDDGSSSLQLLNIGTKEKGEEVFAVYGTYPNSKLVYSYGFVIYGNARQAVDLWTRVSASTSMAETKQRILQSNQVTALAYSILDF